MTVRVRFHFRYPADPAKTPAPHGVHLFVVPLVSDERVLNFSDMDAAVIACLHAQDQPYFVGCEVLGEGTIH